MLSVFLPWNYFPGLTFITSITTLTSGNECQSIETMAYPSAATCRGLLAQKWGARLNSKNSTESLGYPGVRCLRKGQNYYNMFPIISWHIWPSQADASVVKLWYDFSARSHVAIRTEVFGLPSNVIFGCFWLGRCFAVLYTLYRNIQDHLPKRRRKSTNHWCCFFAMYASILSFQNRWTDFSLRQLWHVQSHVQSHVSSNVFYVS